MNIPLVSIVIPVYNGENYLQNAIKSALSQTYQNCEIIVVNDGSTDSTEQIALSFGDKIKYLHKENGGVATAVNCGIENMSGEYFSWLSHDDEYYPDKVERGIAALRHCEDKTTPVFGNYDLLDISNSRFIESNICNSHKHEKVSNSIYPLLFELVNGNTVLLHRSEFECFGLFNENLRSTQDYDLWFRIFRMRRLCFINQPLVKTRLHPLQGTNTIKEHDNSRDALHHSFATDIIEDEMIEMFGSKYNFHYNILKYHTETKLLNCINLHKSEFLKSTEPTDSTQLQNRLSELLNEKSGIILLGAGKKGKEIQNELYVRGIEIKGFVDNYANVYEKPNLALHDNMIIITPEDTSGVIRSQMIDLDCRYWLSYSQVMRMLRDVPPIKARVIQVMFDGVM